MSSKISFFVPIFCVFIFLNSCKIPVTVVSQEKEVVEPTSEEVAEQVSENTDEAVVPVAEIPQEAESTGPKADKEFRAAWIASVANINWPSKPGLSSKEQQQEAIALLDLLKEHNFNAAILQIRPQTDALYESDLEPWSYFLTGEQGKAPDPYYDPLHFWIEAAHDRGLELHAWFNPYRAQHTSGKNISEQSIIKTNPELVVKLNDGHYWMDPAQQGTQDHSTAVVMDVVKRYDVDGIHFDDYFYPYDSYHGGDFPDDVSWEAYQTGGGELSRGDWRRESVNTFIENLYENIKAEKPHVKFGLSPFGIWRPGYPESIAGYDQYDKLYADAKLWLNEGWIDYYTPQLYWQINRIPQSFPVLLGWWSDQNFEKRHLWPGINAAFGDDEVINQIMITRGMMPKSPGVVHWSIAPMVKSQELATAILEGPYQREALVPTSPWLDSTAPEAPVAVPEIDGDTLKITWVPADAEDAFRYVVHYRYNDNWNYRIMNRKDNEIELPAFSGKNRIRAIAVSAVDRTGNESEFQEIPIGK